MQMNKCPKCDALNTLKSKECRNCGADISSIGKLKYQLMMVAIFIVIIYLVQVFK